MEQYVTSSPEETILLGKALAGHLHGGEIVAFTGGMGAGKTTFCRGMAQGLAVQDQVQSPTFSIANLYRGPLPMAHFDAYRISGPEDLETAGFYEYLAQGAVLALEWSENVDEWPQDVPVIKVDMQVQGENERKITIEGMEAL